MDINAKVYESIRFCSRLCEQKSEEPMSRNTVFLLLGFPTLTSGIFIQKYIEEQVSR